MLARFASWPVLINILSASLGISLGVESVTYHFSVTHGKGNSLSRANATQSYVTESPSQIGCFGGSRLNNAHIIEPFRKVCNSTENGYEMGVTVIHTHFIECKEIP